MEHPFPPHDPDLEGMQRAVAAAWCARRSVAPRPWVGAAVVPAGVDPAVGPVFTGATDGRSGPHAEVNALAAAGDAARGGTLYCTLEPCSHHGVTPPCADAIVAAGVARVVVALVDPDPHVAGSGLDRLGAAGIEIEVGVGAELAEAQLAPYLKHRRTGRPWVVLKMAATLDGVTAAADGTSQWITGPEARLDAHGLRADSDAVLVGAGTVRADDPRLTVRSADGEPAADQPLRVVLGTAPPDAAIHPALELGGSLTGVLDHLGERGVLQVLVEGGASVAHDLHAAGLVDRYVIYLAPALAGGNEGRPLLDGAGPATISDLWRGQIVAVQRLGHDLRVDLEPVPAPVDDAAGTPERSLAAVES